MTQMLMGGADGPVPAWSGALVRSVATPALAQATLNVNTNGTLTGTNYTGDSDWYRPSGGSPGSSYYAKFTMSGDAWTAGGLTDGTVYALSSTRTVTWSTTAGAFTGTLTVSIYSDAGGTQLVGTGTVTVSVQST